MRIETANDHTRRVGQPPRLLVTVVDINLTPKTPPRDGRQRERSLALVGNNAGLYFAVDPMRERKSDQDSNRTLR